MRSLSVLAACLALALALSACDAGVTTLRLSVTLAAGQPAPQSLLISVYDRSGALAPDHTVTPQQLMLPGQIEVLLGSAQKQVRVAVSGSSAGGQVVRGDASVAIVPHVQNRGSMTLSTTLADSDGDGVPDEIDNCPNVANHDQTDSNGGPSGDACSGDLGGVDLPPPHDLAAPGDLRISDDMVTPADLLTPVDANHQVMLGDTTIESSTDDHTAGQGEASVFQAIAAGGTVSGIHVYLSPGSTTTELLVAIYDDTGVPHHPRNRLSQGVIANPVAGAWNAASITPVAVTGGGTYWLCFVSPAGFGTFNFPYGGSAGLTTEHSQEAGLSDMPATWTAGTDYPDTVVSIYATE